jgi:hypothetical protein
MEFIKDEFLPCGALALFQQVFNKALTGMKHDREVGCCALPRCMILDDDHCNPRVRTALVFLHVLLFVSLVIGPSQ